MKTQQALRSMVESLVRYRMRYFAGVMSIATLILGFACTPMAAMESDSTGFVFSSSTNTVAIGASIQLMASGGTAPYSYALTGGVGFVTSQGVYTAPSSMSSGTTATITATDANGASRLITLAIIGSITYTLVPSTPAVSEAISIYPSGGTASYTYTIASGGGSLNGNVYTTASYQETATIIIFDATAATTQVSISTGGVSASGFGGNISALWFTPLGSHVPGGQGCSANAQELGAVADASGGTIYGDQILCGATADGSSSTVLTNFTVSQSSSCPSGYSQIGSIANCQAGYSCNSTQAVCAAWGTAGSSSRTVSDVYFTAEGARSVSVPACQSGYTNMGKVADCGNGTCYGLQSICVSY